jgi:methyl-accepting chemotaxis protein
MPAGNLDTTNLLLGIMAAVSVLEALLIIAGGVLAYRLYAQAMRTVHELEERQIAPLVARVNGLMARADEILSDVRDVTARVTRRTERVDAAIDDTVGRVDETAQRVRESVVSQVRRMIGLVQAAKFAVREMFNGRREAA